MRAENDEILVIGAGVIGLSTGIRLLEAGLPVRILTDEEPRLTTSANSGAIWGPFLSKLDERVLAWSFRTFDVLRELSKLADSGVQMVDGIGAADFPTSVPGWVEALEGSSDCHQSELPPPYIRGWRYRVPIIDIPIYINYLLSRFLASGGNLTLQRVSTLEDFYGLASHLVICAGIGSRELVGDPTLLPSKGQLVVAENPGISTFFAERGDGPNLTYILPQGEKVVLGGTAEEEYTNADPDPALLDQILKRCIRIEPRLASSKILSYRVGIRPCRPTVNLRHDILPEGPHIVYNYGHGGSGVSLSWACAQVVTHLILDCLHNS